MCRTAPKKGEPTTGANAAPSCVFCVFIVWILVWPAGRCPRRIAHRIVRRKHPIEGYGEHPAEPLGPSPRRLFDHAKALMVDLQVCVPLVPYLHDSRVSASQTANHASRANEASASLGGRFAGCFCAHSFRHRGSSASLENETLASCPLSKITASGVGCLAYAESPIEEIAPVLHSPTGRGLGFGLCHRLR